MTNKTTTISKENSGEGDILSPAVYYRFPKDFEMKEGISHEHHYRHTVRDIVNKQGRKYTEHLLSATMEAGFDLHAIPAVLLGGGASVVSRHLSPKDGLCKTIFLLDDKVNAVGFERALTAVSRRKSEA